MKKPKKPNQELKEVQSELNRINSAYAGQLGNMNQGFKDYVLNKTYQLKRRKYELEKQLGYV